MSTSVVVSSANSPYAVLHTDAVVEFDESNGLLATANLPAAGMAIDETHTFVWFKYTAGAPPPLINGNGNNVVPYAQGVQTSGAVAASTNITNQGGIYRVSWDGTQWMLTGVA